MRLFGRIIVVIFAVMLASFAAGTTIATGIFGPQWHTMSGDIGDRIFFWIIAVFASTFTGRFVMLPAAILIAIAEGFKIRALLANVAGGTAMLLLAYYGVDRGPREESIDHPPPPVSREIEIVAAAGAVFGLTYWLIAGRNAGRWRESHRPADAA